MRYMTDDFLNVLTNCRKSVSVNPKTHYADSYIKNIYPNEMDETHIRMFCKGGGKELYPQEAKKEKAACIFSSSMLSYNFFHWINDSNALTLDGIDYTKVVFEEQFRVLKTRNNKANLDVALISRDGKTLLLLESKFTEHLDLNGVEIKDAYYLGDSYFENGDKWVEVFNSLIESMEKSSGKDAYYEGLKQVCCHLIGISGAMMNEKARRWFNHNSWIYDQCGRKLEDFEIVLFRSLVFHPATENDGNRSGDYEEKNRAFVKMIKEKKFLPSNLIITDPIMTYRDLWNKGMAHSVKDPDLKKYLEEYLSAHA